MLEAVLVPRAGKSRAVAAIRRAKNKLRSCFFADSMLYCSLPHHVKFEAPQKFTIEVEFRTGYICIAARYMAMHGITWPY